MLAIKADYSNGKITFIDAMPERIKKARLTIVVESDDDQEKVSIPAQEFALAHKDSESEFKLIGLNSFFDTEDDKNVNWEDYFGLK
jgi:hypothetical protein